MSPNVGFSLINILKANQWSRDHRLTLSKHKQVKSSGFQKCRTDISQFLICLCLTLKMFRLIGPALSFLVHFPPSFVCLSMKQQGDPGLNTKCLLVPSMQTTQCSLILKLVNIDRWLAPGATQARPKAALSLKTDPQTSKDTCSPGDYHGQPDQFSDISVDKQLRDDTVAPYWAAEGTAGATRLCILILEECTRGIQPPLEL